MNVVILFNAPSLPPDHADYASEAGVLEAVEAVEASLSRHGHRHCRLAVGATPAAIIDDLARAEADVLVNLCEGLGGTGSGESQVTGLIELLGIPFTGSGSECLALARDKARTKWMFLGAGLPTPAFQYLAPDDALHVELFEPALDAGPLIVKPAHEDASLGISPASVVTDASALVRQVDEVRRRYGEVLVEQYITGREFNVGVLALPEPEVLPLAEIKFLPDPQSPWNMVTYDAKWTPGTFAFGGTPARCPADVAPELAAELRRVSLAAFRLTGCRDYARVDFRVDGDERVYILEVNSNPDISPSAGLAREILAAGLSYDQFVCRLVETAQRRATP